MPVRVAPVSPGPVRRLRHVLSPAEAAPETLAGYLCLGIAAGNRTRRTSDLPNKEPGDDYRAFMQAVGAEKGV